MITRTVRARRSAASDAFVHGALHTVFLELKGHAMTPSLPRLLGPLLVACASSCALFDIENAVVEEPEDMALALDMGAAQDIRDMDPEDEPHARDMEPPELTPDMPSPDMEEEAPDMAPPLLDMGSEDMDPPDMTCVPSTCAELGATCGELDDTCGALLRCGECTSPQTCGGGGVDHQCGCTPTRSCKDLPAECGMLDDDGCGQAIDCGMCPAQRCPQDFEDCDMDPSTGIGGCETDTFSRGVSDRPAALANCGGCGQACGARDQYCFQGDCYD